MIDANDAVTLAIVLGGTLLATLLRAGFGETAVTLQALGGAMAARWRPTFDADSVRAQLAVQLQQIQRDGLLRAMPRRSGDAEFDEVSSALIGTRSLAGLIAIHEGHRAGHARRAAVAVETLNMAAELAPVFGLAGTLLSLSHLPANGVDRGAYLAAIGMAVHATLVGLILANLLLAPLARLVERGARDEAAARQSVVDWLTRGLAPVMAPVAPQAPAPAQSRGVAA